MTAAIQVNDREKGRDAVRSVPEHVFIRDLVTQVRAGYRLVPFFGSGCSAHSGILMGNQFNAYLAWTVALCVADRKQYPQFGPKRWDLRRNGWPAAPSHGQLNDTRTWAEKEFARLGGECLKYIDGAERVAPSAAALFRELYLPFPPPILSNDQPNFPNKKVQGHLHRLLTEDGLVHGGLPLPGFSPTSDDAIVERAIRSLYDWRSTLRFLSELKLGRDQRTLFLEKSEPSVIDSFNVHITRGRRPNLAHTMLAHLRQPAGIRVVLTTNFDTLIEDAFAQQQRRLEVISVSVRGALPDPEVVHARDTVVKLHGTFSETRADFSLDEQPSLEDRKRFFHYVRGGYPDDDQPAFVPGHLLVAGYSGSDARCVQLMKTILEGDPQSLIYWVCHSKRDEARLAAEIFPEKTYGSRVVVTTTERVDLLLYEFHQQLCLTLPPGGSSYHINHNVPPIPRFRPEALEEGEGAPGAPKIVNELDWLEASSQKLEHGAAVEPQRKIVVVDGPSGVLNAMRSALGALSEKHSLEKVWLELEDHGNTASLAHDLFQIIAARRGVLHLSHAELVTEELAGASTVESGQRSGAALARQWKEHVLRLKEHLNIEPTQWVIALYGRNGPGGCVGWEDDECWSGDVESDRAEYGSESEVSPFLAFMVGLRDAGFNVLYAPYSKSRGERDRKRGDELLAAVGLPIGSDEGRELLKEFATPEAHSLDAMERNYELFFEPKGLEQSDIDAWRKALPWKPCDLQPELAGAQLDSFVPRLQRLLEKEKGVTRPASEPAPESSAPVGSSMPPPLAVPASSPRFKSQGYLGERWRSQLLYGASLFRQSRHYSSFLCEGVMRCPKRFNLDGYDNDLLRHHDLEKFLDDADREQRIFLRKPGGFAWLYRDMRFALRCLVESASQRTKGGVSGSARAGRTRAHFSIGDWYLRAFRVSAHASPLMEAAFHFYQSLRHAHEALPLRAVETAQEIGVEQIFEYRKTVWRRGLHQLV